MDDPREQQSRKPLLGFRIVTIVLALIVGTAICEVVVRRVHPQPTYAYLVKLVGAQYAPSDFNPFTLKRNYRGTAPSMEQPNGIVQVTTNSLGLRAKETTVEKPAGTKRILVLGDSYTFGVYVGDRETYSAVLEELLRGDGLNVEVINAGYATGWDTDHQYCWLVNRGLAFDPDVVILGFFVGNDIMNIRPAQWAERDARGLPTRIVDDSIYIDAIGRLRRVRDYDPGEIIDITIPMTTVGDQLVYRLPLLRESHVLVLLGTALEGLLRDFQIEGLWVGDSLDWYPHIFKKQDDRFDEQERHFLELLAGMKALTDERGIRLLVLMIPFNFQVDPSLMLTIFPQHGRALSRGEIRIQRNYFEELKPKLEAMDIEYVDSFQRMRSAGGRYYPRNGEVHFNAQGHAFVAEQLAAELGRLGWLD